MLHNITSPTLLIDESIVKANLARMAGRAARHRLAFRPHFKTHQSEIVGEWCRELGITEITVTSYRMAAEFAAQGWQKIIIAMPVNPREFGLLAALAEKVELAVFVVDEQTAAALPAGLRYFIEVDAGYGRSGVSWEDTEYMKRIIAASGTERFRGLYVHSGHTYEVLNAAAIAPIHQEFLHKINETKARLNLGVACEVAMGDTPAASTQEDFRGITSLGPGNFVYYDLTQAAIGACQMEDIAVCLAAPVVQVHPPRNEVIVHAGWVQLGKDQLPDGTYGKIVPLNADGSWGEPLKNAFVYKLSQEHGTLKLPEEVITGLKTGNLLGILPVHACAMVHGMKVTGNQVVVNGGESYQPSKEGW